MNTRDNGNSTKDNENRTASPETDNKPSSEPDSITEASLSAFLRRGESVAGPIPEGNPNAGSQDEEKPIPDSEDESDMPLEEEATPADLSEDAAAEDIAVTYPTEIRAEDILTGNGKDPESSPNVSDVLGTMTRLQELDQILKELNFREMIVRFGQLQAEVDVLRDGLHAIDQILAESRQSFGNLRDGDAKQVQDVVTGFLDHMEQTTAVLEESDRFKMVGKSQCLDLISQALDTLKILHEAHVSRLGMAAQLSGLVDSDASNERLASAALEFAVYINELDVSSEMSQFEQAVTELEVLRDEFQVMQDKADPMIITEDLGRLKQRVEDIQRLPQLVGNARQLIERLDGELESVRVQLEGSLGDNGSAPDKAGQEPEDSSHA